MTEFRMGDWDQCFSIEKDKCGCLGMRVKDLPRK